VLSYKARIRSEVYAVFAYMIGAEG